MSHSIGGTTLTKERRTEAAGPSLRAWVRAHAEIDAGRGHVLFHAPTAAFQAPGGGENQLVQTARHLEGLGVGVRLFSPWVDRVEDYRLLHVFGMSREGLALASVARRRGVPVAALADLLARVAGLEPARVEPRAWRSSGMPRSGG